jgi:putative ABC transport system substrate-binding protein
MQALRRPRTVGFLVLWALSLLAAPLVGVAQPVRDMPRLGMLLTSRAGEPSPYLEAFRQGLRERGWVEGQNIVLEYRYAERQLERLPALAAELVHLPVDILFANTAQGAWAVRQATQTIPTVFETLGDPVAFGLVESLERPGGNLTGVGGIAPDLYGKHLELLKEVLPGLTRVALLINPTNPNLPAILHEAVRSEQAIGVHVRRLEVHDIQALDTAFATLTDVPVEALIVAPDSLLLSQRHRIVGFASQHRLPVISEIKAFAEAGGLLTYGASLPAQWHRAAYYVDRLLKGARPAELPVERPTTFELVINLKTAQALGLTISPTLLFQADEVIK